MLYASTSKALASAVARDQRSLCRGGASRRRLAPCEGSAMSAPTLTYPLRAALDCAGHGFALVPGPTVRTGGGGRHFYFSFREGMLLPKTAGDGLDLLANGRIACAPYSEHVSGQRYAWEVRPW